jgi:hypothetical protein
MMKTLATAAILAAVTFAPVQSREIVEIDRYCTDLLDLTQAIDYDDRSPTNCHDDGEALYRGTFHMKFDKGVYEIGVHSDKYDGDVLLFTFKPLEGSKKGLKIVKTYEGALETVFQVLVDKL